MIQHSWPLGEEVVLSSELKAVHYVLVAYHTKQCCFAMTQPKRVREVFKKRFAWELELQRPLRMLRRQVGRWPVCRVNEFCKPSAVAFKDRAL